MFPRLTKRSKEFRSLLLKGDLGTIGNVDSVISLIYDQKSFDDLFLLMFDDSQAVLMRTLDAVEKITNGNNEYLQSHKDELLSLFNNAINKEFKWHMAQLISRIELNEEQLDFVWNRLVLWASHKGESRIVRVNSLQALYNISLQHKELDLSFELLQIMEDAEKENIASINARIRLLKAEIKKRP